MQLGAHYPTIAQRRACPIAYNNWIHEQVVEMLGLPELYDALLRLLALERLDTSTLLDRAAALRGLLNAYIDPVAD